MTNLIILTLMSLLCTVIGYHLLEKGKNLKSSGIKVKGIVVGNNYKILNHKSSGVYHPVVKFVSENNENIMQELSIGTNPAKAVGTEIDLLYDPLNPYDVHTNSPLALTYMPWFIFLLGFFGCILSISEFLGITAVIE